jgi:hypothetical protein
MPPVGFKLTIPVFERTKTVHASDRAATVIGFCNYLADKIMNMKTDFACVNLKCTAMFLSYFSDFITSKIHLKPYVKIMQNATKIGLNLK